MQSAKSETKQNTFAEDIEKGLTSNPKHFRQNIFMMMKVRGFFRKL